MAEFKFTPPSETEHRFAHALLDIVHADEDASADELRDIARRVLDWKESQLNEERKLWAQSQRLC